MTETFDHEEKTTIADIVATKTPRRHNVVKTAYYVFWSLFILQMLLRVSLDIEHRFFSDISAILFLIFMYKLEVSNREQLIRKFALGAKYDIPNISTFQKKQRELTLHFLKVTLITITLFAILLWILFSH